jgi:hypothetical protein
MRLQNILTHRLLMIDGSEENRLIPGCVTMPSKLPLVAAFVTFLAVTAPMHADEAAESNIQTGSQPPTAAEARVRLWTAIFVDGETKKPLERLTVEFRCWKSGHREPQPMTFSSGSGGEVKLPLASGTHTEIEVKGKSRWLASKFQIGDFPKERYPPDEKPPAADPSKPVTFDLWKGTEVRGKMLQPDGKPAAGILLHVGAYINNMTWYEKYCGHQMELHNWDHGDWPNWQTSLFTDKDGSFSAIVPPHDARSWVRVGTVDGDHSPIIVAKDNPHPHLRALLSYAPFIHQVQTQDIKNQEVIDLDMLQLARGVVLKGRVVDADGKPLSKIPLYTSSKHGPYAGRSTESAADGSFEFLPMSPGKITLTPRAELRNEKDEKISRDVQAVFVRREITLPDSDKPVDLTLQALRHATIEFEWIDRRANKGPVAYYGTFHVSGKLEAKNQPPFWWDGETEKTTRDGKAYLFVKVPVDLVEPSLQLAADTVVTASYEDDKTKAGPGTVPLGDITQPRRRIIYGDEPQAQNK